MSILGFLSSSWSSHDLCALPLAGSVVQISCSSSISFVVVISTSISCASFNWFFFGSANGFFGSFLAFTQVIPSFYPKVSLNNLLVINFDIDNLAKTRQHFCEKTRHFHTKTKNITFFLLLSYHHTNHKTLPSVFPILIHCKLYTQS